MNYPSDKKLQRKVLGIVLARAGSKGLPGKNHLELLGKPLVQFAIEAGLRAKYIDDVILSSDCDLCMRIAINCGAEVPFKRPAHLASDTATSADVICHALEFLEQAGRKYDTFVLIEPTSPLREACDIDSALESLMDSGKTALVSVCRAEDQHPDFMFRRDETGGLAAWSGESFLPKRRQEVSLAYFLDGSVYISDVDTFKKKKTFCHENTLGYEVPKWKSYEIDDMWDLVCVEAILRYRRQNRDQPNARQP